MGKKIFLLTGSQFDNSDITNAIAAFSVLLGEEKTKSVLQDKKTQELIGLYKAGKIKAKEFFTKLKESSKLDPTIEDLQKAWDKQCEISENTFKKLEVIARLIESSNNSFQLLIVSYTNSSQQDYVMEQLLGRKITRQDGDITKQTDSFSLAKMLNPRFYFSYNSQEDFSKDFIGFPNFLENVANKEDFNSLLNIKNNNSMISFLSDEACKNILRKCITEENQSQLEFVTCKPTEVLDEIIKHCSKQEKQHVFELGEKIGTTSYMNLGGFISDSGALTKIGTSTLTLGGINTHAGLGLIATSGDLIFGDGMLIKGLELNQEKEESKQLNINTLLSFTQKLSISTQELSASNEESTKQEPASSSEQKNVDDTNVVISIKEQEQEQEGQKSNLQNKLK